MSDNLSQTLDFAVFTSFIMAAQWGRPLYFAAVVSFFFFFFLSFFFFVNLSGHRLNVYYTSTHAVAFV